MAFLSLKIDFVFANSADPDEMPNYAEFHLGLHSLPMSLLGVSDLQRVKRFLFVVSL